MKRIIALALVGLATLVASLPAAGCTTATAAAGVLVEADHPTQAPHSGEPSPELVQAVNDFGVDLLRTTAEESKDNVIISPFSVHAALSMTANGATEETADQMRKVLRTDSMSRSAANENWASLLGALGNRSPDQTLEIANSLWARKETAFKQPFLDADRDYFGAQLTTLDFVHDDVAGAINGWAADNTHKMITEVVDEVPTSAVLFLANAVYFKGDWFSPFEHNATGEEQFTRTDGSTTNVQMMHTCERLPYAETPELHATKLTYEGDDTAFYVMLPKPGVSIDAAERSLGNGGFADLRRGLSAESTGQVRIGLPRFDMDYSASLAGPLAEMGMPRAFDPDNAQFSDMATFDVPPIFIDDVIHKTKVRVDEKGTEAAAVTVVAMEDGAAAPVEAVHSIICDRPYVFAIADEKTGAMLFLGAVTDPGE